jgi:hypothetical protein
VEPQHSPPNAVEVLLQTATAIDFDVEDCVSLVDAAIAHLQSEIFQKQMVADDQFGVPLRLLLRTYCPEEDLSTAHIPSLDTMATVSYEREEEAELSRIRKSLILTLSDISALPEFASMHASLKTHVTDSLTQWLSSGISQLQLCACVVLGNLAQTDTVCESMVARLHLHQNLVVILSSNCDSQVAHSVLGFLRNLALPKENKRLIGEVGCIEALPKYLSSDSLPQISHAAAALARQLIIGNLVNTKRLLAPLSHDGDNTAHSRTFFSLLLALFSKTDEVGIKTEVARLVAAVLRCLQSSEFSGDSGKEAYLQRLYELHPDVAEPLRMMILQSKYPVIRSEGWFALALMARSQEGAITVHKIVADVDAFTALEDTIRGIQSDNGLSTHTSTDSALADAAATATPTSVPETPPEMRTKDRENATILVSELLRHQVGLKLPCVKVP